MYLNESYYWDINDGTVSEEGFYKNLVTYDYHSFPNTKNLETTLKKKESTNEEQIPVNDLELNLKKISSEYKESQEDEESINLMKKIDEVSGEYYKNEQGALIKYGQSSPSIKGNSFRKTSFHEKSISRKNRSKESKKSKSKSKTRSQNDHDFSSGKKKKASAPNSKKYNELSQLMKPLDKNNIK